MSNSTDNVKNIVWISSYPKSGNTWVRFLLLNLIYGKQETTKDLNRLIPDIHKSDFTSPPPDQPTTFIKSHFKMSEDMPLLERTAGFIYVVRNPIDVVLSNLNYYFWTHSIPNDPVLRDKIKADYIGNGSA
jgi:hypothetical protein